MNYNNFLTDLSYFIELNFEVVIYE